MILHVFVCLKQPWSLFCFPFVCVCVCPWLRHCEKHPSDLNNDTRRSKVKVAQHGAVTDVTGFQNRNSGDFPSSKVSAGVSNPGGAACNICPDAAGQPSVQGNADPARLQPPTRRGHVSSLNMNLNPCGIFIMSGHTYTLAAPSVCLGVCVGVCVSLHRL